MYSSKTNKTNYTKNDQFRKEKSSLIDDIRNEKEPNGIAGASEFDEYFNGFVLEKIIRCVPRLSRTHSGILSSIGNRSAANDLYSFRQSYPSIAKMVNASEGTVRRAIAAAVDLGILIKTRTYSSSNKNKCNFYQFSRAFLEKAKQVAIACKEKSYSLTNESAGMRQVAKRVFADFDLPQFQSDQDDQAQSDQPDQTKEKNTKPRKILKRQCAERPSGSPAVQPAKNTEKRGGNPQGVNENVVFHALAAAKSRASNLRAKKRYAEKQRIHEKAERLAKKFAWLRGAPDRKRSTIPAPAGAGDFSGYPTVCTVSDALEIAKAKGFVSEFDRKDWSIPPGFRGA